MTFAPADFAAVADRLRSTADAGECPPDAARRAAIGRYYYAALLTARDFLAASAPMPTDNSEQTHRWVIGQLRASIDSESQKLTSELNSMRIARNRADYGDELPDVAGEARRMAERCTRALRYVAVLARRYAR